MSSRRRTVASKPARLGVVMLVVTLLIAAGLFSKDKINTLLMSGRTITVHFDQAYKLRPDVSKVKIAYVVVGKVSGVERDPAGGALVHLKVDRDALDQLGSQPSAAIRPTTLLGGSYFVDLEPGGDPGAFTAASIPVGRTSVPVELDKVARALQPSARAGVRSATRAVDDTLDPQGRRALVRLLRTAPDTLSSARGVLKSLQGEQPDRDLGQLVTGMEATGRVLSSDRGRLDRILTNLATTSAVLGHRSGEVGQAIGALPHSLGSARTGLRDLDGTLTRLRDVSRDLGPTATNLSDMLRTAGPVVRRARPLVRDLRVLLHQARPTLQNLTPDVASANRVLTDVRGTVLHRVDRRVMPFLHEKYQGKGPYSMTSSDKQMYQEVSYMFADLTRASSMMDANGHAVNFQPGVGSGSITGTPISVEQMFKMLTYAFTAPHPINTVPPLSGSGGAGTGLSSLLSGLLGGAR